MPCFLKVSFALLASSFQVFQNFNELTFFGCSKALTLRRKYTKSWEQRVSKENPHPSESSEEYSASEDSCLEYPAKTSEDSSSSSEDSSSSSEGRVWHLPRLYDDTWRREPTLDPNMMFSTPTTNADGGGKNNQVTSPRPTTKPMPAAGAGEPAAAGDAGK